jgi:hypothetical protein
MRFRLSFVAGRSAGDDKSDGTDQNVKCDLHPEDWDKPQRHRGTEGGERDDAGKAFKQS